MNITPQTILAVYIFLMVMPVMFLHKYKTKRKKIISKSTMYILISIYSVGLIFGLMNDFSGGAAEKSGLLLYVSSLLAMTYTVAIYKIDLRE